MNESDTAQSHTSKLLNLNTKDAGIFVDKQRGFCKFSFNGGIQCPPQFNLLVSLYSAIVPYSWYNVSGGSVVEDLQITQRNNLVPMVINGSAIPYANLYPMTAGKYPTYVLMFAELKRVVDLQLLGSLGAGYTSTFSFDEVIGVFQVSIENTSGAESGTIDFDFSGTNNPLYQTLIGKTAVKILGLSEGYVNGPRVITELTERVWNANCLRLNEIGDGKTQTAMFPRTPDLYFTKAIHLLSDLTPNSMLTSTYSDISSICGVIPVNLPIEHTNPEIRNLYFNPNNARHKILVSQGAIDSITIQVQDDEGYTLDLNGADFQCMLQIDFVPNNNFTADLTREQEVALPLVGISGISPFYVSPTLSQEQEQEEEQKDKERKRRVGRPRKPADELKNPRRKKKDKDNKDILKTQVKTDKELLKLLKKKKLI